MMFHKHRTMTWKEIQQRLSTPLILATPIYLTLVRHASTRMDEEGLITGTLDIDLSAKGREEAIEIAKKLQGHYHFACMSALARTQHTFSAVLRDPEVSIGAFRIDHRLNECNYGVLTGQPEHGIKEYADGDIDYAPEGGESYGQVAQRVMSFLIGLADLSAQKGWSNILIVGHNGSLKMMVGILQNISNPLQLSFKNGEVLPLRVKTIEYPNFLR